LIDSGPPLARAREESTPVESASTESPACKQSSAAKPPKPVTLIKARGGWQAVNLVQLWAYRELLFFLVWRDIKVRYKQTVLGAAWAIIQPVMTMLVFSLFFGRLGGMSGLVDVPYPVFVYTGLLAWTLFAAVVSQASVSLVNSGNMISKIYFPRLLIPLATAGTALVDFLLSLVVMAFLMAGYTVSGYNLLPSFNIFLLPIFVVGTLFGSLGVGTLCAALVVAYRDFRYVITFVVQLWMFASPVAYPLEAVPAGWRLLYAINPVVGMISGFRSCLLDEPFAWDCIGVSFLGGLGFLLAGLFYFRQVERRFADII
jgi:lipopolysaccharide transport system permease protein